MQSYLWGCHAIDNGLMNAKWKMEVPWTWYIYIEICWEDSWNYHGEMSNIISLIETFSKDSWENSRII
jgi:hypothetical protein